MATVICKNNFSEYDKMVDIAQKLGVSEFEMSEIIDWGNAKDHPELVLSYDQVKELRLYNLKRSFDTPMIRAGLGVDRLGDNVFDAEELKGREMCNAGRSACAIAPDGQVYPCQLFMGFPEMSAGNIRDQSILEMWADSFENFRKLTARDIEKCASCKCLSSCAGGCRARAYARCGSLYAPMDDMFCKISCDILDWLVGGER